MKTPVQASRKLIGTPSLHAARLPPVNMAVEMDGTFWIANEP